MRTKMWHLSCPISFSEVSRFTSN